MKSLTEPANVVAYARKIVAYAHIQWSRLHQFTKRNVIIYYSGWMQKPTLRGTEVNDADKNGFMTVVQGLDRKIGLDLVRGVLDRKRARCSGVSRPIR